MKSCFSIACGSKQYKAKCLLYQIHLLFTHTSGCIETAHWFVKKQNRVRIRLRLSYLKLEWNQSWIWGLHCSNRKQSEFLHFSLCDIVNGILKPVCLGFFNQKSYWANSLWLTGCSERWGKRKSSPAVYCSDLEWHLLLQAHLLTLILLCLWYFSRPEPGHCWKDLQLYLDCLRSLSVYQCAQFAWTCWERNAL